MVKVAIVGGSGYTGLELIRLLAVHPEVELTAITSRQYLGKAVGEIFPAMAGAVDLSFSDPAPDRLAAEADLFFMAVPHKTAMGAAPGLLNGGGKVIDLSADFRFNDAEVYAEWYDPHTAPDLLAEAVYGLPELHRDKIRTARLVGNPGCYPTSVILAMSPLLKAGLIDPDSIIADSKSGVSGAGRGLAMTSMFCEIDDGMMAYKVSGHRHTPEIEQELSLMAGRPLKISFTPHLIPMSRGILSTVYASLKPGVDAGQVHDAVKTFYQGEFFVRVKKSGELPHTLDVRGTNFCDLGVFVDERTRRVKMVSVIDNLTRGASGQAVCNMNIMLGFPETMGLKQFGLRP